MINVSFEMICQISHSRQKAVVRLSFSLHFIHSPLTGQDGSRNRLSPAQKWCQGHNHETPHHNHVNAVSHDHKMDADASFSPFSLLTVIIQGHIKDILGLNTGGMGGGGANPLPAGGWGGVIIYNFISPSHMIVWKIPETIAFSKWVTHNHITRK